MYLAKDIIIKGNSLLQEICTPVKLPLNNEDLNVLTQLYEYVVISEIPSLVEQYKIRPGVGIAAPQVGVTKRMFAINFVDFLDESQTKYLMALINPVILKKSKRMTYLPGGEGCLSVLDDTTGLLTKRHYEITFKASVYNFETKKIKTITKTLSGYPAIVFQHEYDHLDGILFTDKLSSEILDCDPLYEIEETQED